MLAFPLSEENIRHIGGLEIPLPLYNIYLGETEELLRVLAVDFADWRAQPLRAASSQALRQPHAGRHLGHGGLPRAVRDRDHAGGSAAGGGAAP